MSPSATVPAVTPRRVNPADLLDAAQVATLLGLTNQKGVGSYRSKYADFPQPAVTRNSGRCLLWLRQDIERWRRQHPGHQRNRDAGAGVEYPEPHEAHGPTEED